MQSKLAIRLATVLVLLLGGVSLLVSGMRQAAIAQEPGTPPPEGIGPVLLAGLEQAEARVNGIRGFESPVLVNRALYPFSQFEAVAAAQLETTYTAEDAERDVLFYSVFGFMPTNFNLLNTVQNISVTPRSHYNPTTGTLNVLSTNDTPLTPLDSLDYVYGYTQAMQDIQHDVYAQRDQAIANGNIDQAMAINALIQGDARLTLQFYITELIEMGVLTVENVIGRTGITTETLPDNTPTILTAEQRFATEDGFDFVQELYRETESWRLVDLVYERLPLSTEHILHPTLYLLYEPPHNTPVYLLDDFWQTQDLNADDWELAYDQRLGEFYLRAHLELLFMPDMVDTLATGWGGDRFLLYTDNSGNNIVVWRISWDTTEDFTAFNLRYGEFISAWLNIAGEQYEDGSQCWQGARRSICKGTVDEEDVLITQAPTLDLALNLLLFERDLLSVNRILG